jgi:hypothetical protein
MLLTGWSRMLTTWIPLGTTHAVHAERVDTCVAVCGSPLVVINLTRPWSRDDAADAPACRRCTELVHSPTGSAPWHSSAPED